MSLLVLSGSFRQSSYTRRVATSIAKLAHRAELGPDLSALAFFSQDLEDDPPSAVTLLRSQAESAGTVVIVTPEYNGAVPGVLANALDWLSRPYGQGVLRGKRVIAVSASPGDGGGGRALAALSTVLDSIGARVVSEAAIPQIDARLRGAGPDPVLLDTLRSLLAKAEIPAASAA